MENEQAIKEMVRQKYSEVALKGKEDNQASCCDTDCCSEEVNSIMNDSSIMSDNYAELKGYNPDADLGLGCGLPTQFAQIKRGDVVIDLGSGAGNDCFIARSETGETGKVIGIDFSTPMLERARINAEKLGYNNLEFREGDIENMPVSANSADVVVSNCVLNLVPNKDGVFKEIFRVLKQGGHFSISDIVLIGTLPAKIQQAAEMYAGCVAGAIQKNAYLELINSNGFQNITIQKEKPIILPDATLSEYLTPAEIQEFRQSGTGIYSVTVFAQKPKEAACC